MSGRSFLCEQQFIHSLEVSGCQVIHCRTQHAHYTIAKELQANPSAIAICNNSDMCVFPNVRFIPFEQFDLGNDLDLGSASGIPRMPRQLRCGVISSNDVMTKVFGVSCVVT